jgi:glycosyltransferase involved in cell wall biosynthesis
MSTRSPRRTSLSVVARTSDIGGRSRGSIPDNAAAGSLSPFELAIHSLAQLPEPVSLELPRTGDAAMLRVIAGAYGIRHRVRLGAEATSNYGVFKTPRGSVEVAELLPATLAELVEHIGSGSVSSPPDTARDVDLAGERILVVTNYPAHYRLPLFEGLAARLDAVGAHLSVVFLSSGEGSRPWLTGPRPEFDHEILTSVRVPFRQRATLVPSRLEAHVRSRRPTTVIVAGFSPVVVPRLIRASRRLGASVGLWSGETAWTQTAQSRARRRVRVHVARRVDFGIAYGSRAAAYLRSLRADLPIIIGRNTAPVLHSPSAWKPRPDASLELVLVGDLASPRKGVDVAIEAMRLIPANNVRLTVIGGGRLLGSLETIAAADERIRFLGPLAPDDVRRVLAESDALLFPTRSDIFGLVLVEAMGAAVAPLVSDAAGAVDDLVVDGANAVLLHSLDPIEWGSAINLLASNPRKIGELGERARQTIQERWSLDHAVEAMLAGFRLGSLSQRRSIWEARS